MRGDKMELYYKAAIVNCDEYLKNKLPFTIVKVV